MKPGLARSRSSSLRWFLAVTRAASAAATGWASSAADRPLYLDANQPLEARVEDLLGRMTIEEKIAPLHGDSNSTTAGSFKLARTEMLK